MPNVNLPPATPQPAAQTLANNAAPKVNPLFSYPKPTAPPVENNASHKVNPPFSAPKPATSPPVSNAPHHRISIPVEPAKPIKDAKPWALAVIALYLFALVVLAWPVLKIAFWIGPGPAEKAQAVTTLAAGIFFWPYWIFVAIMVLCQVGLLKVPVGVANRRPLTRRSLLLPIIVTGLMIGLLVIGAVFSIYEVIDAEKDGFNLTNAGLYGILAFGGMTWFFWIIFFYFVSENDNPSNVVSQQCRSLLRGSILELLIAVPTHIVARSRDYCCAGFMTFVGITMGLAVMLLSFGPGVFFLFKERWNRLHKYRLPADDNEPLQK